MSVDRVRILLGDLSRGSIFRFLLLCVVLLPAPAVAEWQQAQRDIMGTRISVEFWQPDTAEATRCSDQVFAEMHRIDALMSPYIDSSELSFINRNAARDTLEISAEMARLIERSLHFSRLSGGAFDITYASVGYAYDYRQRKRPDEGTLARKLSAIDYRHIDLVDNRLHFRHDDVRIDLGGIAKGYAVDRAAAIVRDRCGIGQALISAGGDSRIIGDRRGRSWMIGIQHPRDPAGLALRLPLANSAISTSGDYERFYIEDGERVHHIINPATGRSSSNSWSATVTGPDAMTTDALSTTIFVLGADAGISLIETLEGIDAIIIDSQGKLHYSSGFMQPTNEG